uniref:Uncharacterized protein n=1 Tax=viral metagenome TaxID=1070528 RepID=A0A6C0JQX9_9ZZZZ
MGYDYDECICCYMTGGGNRGGTIRPVCAICIEGWSDCGSSGRVVNECMQHRSYAMKCSVCRNERMFMFEVGLCDGCLGSHRCGGTITCENGKVHNVETKEGVEQFLKTNSDIFGVIIFTLKKNDETEEIRYYDYSTADKPDANWVLHSGDRYTSDFDRVVNYVWEFFNEN